MDPEGENLWGSAKKENKEGRLRRFVSLDKTKETRQGI